MLILHISGSLAEQREVAISRFVSSRDAQGLVCLYGFDRFHAGSNVSTTAVNDTDDGTLGRLVPPTLENLLGNSCPFGNLQFDPTLVSSPGDATLPSQLGVHLAEDPTGDAKRPHIASNEVVPAREFMTTMLARENTGFAFEFVFRRRLETNGSMTIFSIGNLFEDCADLGLRLEVTATNQLVFLYHVPVLHDEYVNCHERRFFSGDDCLIPPYRSQVQDNPVIHVTISVEPLAASVGFYIVFVDPVTMQRHQCMYVAWKDPLKDLPYCGLIQGTLRLFIGNNPHNVTNPRSRSRIAMAREYREPYSQSLSPEERLRALIKQRLDSIQGPRLPAAMRLFGAETLSFHILGKDLPPISEDTPYAIIRALIDQFKASYGDDIVEFIVKSLKQAQQKKQELENDNSSGDVDAQNKTQARLPYPDSNGSTFDLFHFAMYNKSLTAENVTKHNWQGWMTPFRPFPAEKMVVHTPEDHEIELDLLQLHSVYDDLHLQIVELPEFGSIRMGEATLDKESLEKFKFLPAESQHKILFVPAPGLSNKNLPRRDRYDFKRTIDPYAVIRLKVWNTTTGRPFNASREGRLEIFVDPVDHPPLLPKATMTITMDRDAQLLDLTGIKSADHKSTKERTLLSGFDALNSIPSLPVGIPSTIPKPGTFAVKNESVQPPSQSLRVLQYPRYGRLYNISLDSHVAFHEFVTHSDIAELERLRIRPEWIHNRSFSTIVGYVRDPLVVVEGKQPALDVMTYQLRQGSNDELSEVGTVRFQLPTERDDRIPSDFVVSSVQMENDSAKAIELPQVEPLVGLLGPLTAFRIKTLPRAGHLYQFMGDRHAADDWSIGLPIHPGDGVRDPRGRIIYVPSFHSTPEKSDGGGLLNSHMFSYEIVADNTTAANATTAAPSVKMPRTIQIQDRRKRSTKMSILPPTIVATTAKMGESVRVPVVFEDPDHGNATYRVVLEAKQSFSKFVLDRPVTDDDVLEFCGFKRPCNVTQSSDGSFVSANSSNSTLSPSALRFIVKARNWDPSRITMEGSKPRLLETLARLQFQDASMWSWTNEHSAKFEVTLSRIDSGDDDDSKVKMMFYVDYAATESDDSDEEDSIGRSVSNLFEMFSVAMWVAVLCFLLSSASCCSVGSCCCCCARARDQKRREFEDTRRRYMEQVVQNDGEYSTMLMGVADVLLEPALRLPTALLRVCEERAESRALSVLTIHSLLPLLETDQQGIRFILHLLSLQDPAQQALGWESSTSTTIAVYCRSKGLSWLQMTLDTIAWQEIGQEADAVRVLLAAVEKNLSKLPPEIVVLSRASAKISTCGAKSTASEVDYVSRVFFDHYLHPAIWFPSYGVRLPRSQRQLLSKAVSRMVGDQADSDCRTHCVRLIKTILVSTVLSDSLDRFSKTEEANAELMSQCLMNMHSILEHAMPFLIGDEDTEISRAKLLLRALNFPIATADVLASACQVALASDEMLWTDLGREAWQARVQPMVHPAAASSIPGRQPPRLHHATSLLSLSLSDEDRSTTAAFQSAASTDVGSLEDIEFEF